MKAIYRKVTPDKEQTSEDEEKWGTTGLLHDVDYEIAQKEDKLDKHGLLIFELEPNVIPEDIAYAIKSHNYEHTGEEPKSPMDWAITCVDQLTGLIVACALVHPEKKLAPLNVEFIKKRMKEKSFARGAMREPILLCEEKLGIPLDEFIDLTLTSMQSISDEIGL